MEAFKRIPHIDYPLIEEMEIYFVGGGVRDRALGLIANDFDFAVVGETVESMFKAGFTVVGKDFPVFHHPITKDEYALARIERKNGVGYESFIFETNGVTIRIELQRRDFTINAMAEDKFGVLIDPYNGMDDLKNKILRHTSEKFAEDPLRVLRLARFTAKLPDFTVADETIKLAISLKHELKYIKKDRVFKELIKALKTDKPSNFFRTLLRVEALEILFPELHAMIGKEQKYEHHAEGDVFEHCLRVLDVACELSTDTRIRYAALYHDIGKPIVFEELESYYGHQGKDVIYPAFQELKDRGHFNKYIDLAIKCSENHHLVHDFKKLTTKVILKIMKSKSFPKKGFEFQALLDVCSADEKGRASGYRKLTIEENDVIFNGGEIEGFTVSKRKIDYSYLIEMFEEVHKSVEIPKHILSRSGHKIGVYVHNQKLKDLGKIKWRLKMKDKMKINLETANNIFDWLGTRNVGVSSDTMLFAITGRTVYSNSRDTPKDGPDFSRCIDLLENVPELKKYLYLVSEEYPIWTPFIREWDVLTDMYYNNFMDLYDLIKTLNKEGRELVA